MQFHHHLATLLTGIQRKTHLPQPVSACGPVPTQCFEPAYSALIARAAGLNPFPNPDFLLRQKLIKPGVCPGLNLKLLCLGPLVICKTARVTAQAPSV